MKLSFGNLAALPLVVFFNEKDDVALSWHEAVRPHFDCEVAQVILSPVNFS